MSHQRRFPIGLLLMAPVALGFAVYAFTGQAQVPDPNATPTTDATLTTIVEETPPPPLSSPAAETPISPPVADTPTPDPNYATQRGPFGEGAWVRVNAGEGDCLNARNQPALNNEWVIVNTCLPHGFEGMIDGDAQQADGHWWWFLAGAGWVAEDYLEYLRDENIYERRVPELTGRGRIALLRQTPDYLNELWLMNADGSEQRLLFPARQNLSPQFLAWTPDGSALTFSTYRDGGNPLGVWDLHIVPVDNPSAARVVENAWGAEWSPDGVHFGTIVDAQFDGMGGPKGIPAVVNAQTGERRMIATGPFWQQLPPSFNHDGTKVLYTYVNGEDSGDPGPRIVIAGLDGNEIARIEPPAETYYASPKWSPVADQLMFHVGSSAQGQPQYVIYDVERRDIIGGARVPNASDKIGGKCGSWDMWAASWSRDGQSVLYDFSMGEAGANGIWRWDLATGEQQLVPAINVGDTSVGPDGSVAFASWGARRGYIFIGRPQGGFPLLLTEGFAPAWSP
jgi:hypothetical protein